MSSRDAIPLVTSLALSILIVLALPALGEQLGDGDAASYEVLDGELEPFRTAFDQARDRVRAVLLVGPT